MTTVSIEPKGISLILSSAEIERLTTQTIEHINHVFDQLINEKQDYVLPILANGLNYFQTMHDQILFWQHVSDDSNVREMSMKCDIKLEKWKIDFLNNKTLYHKLLEYYRVKKEGMDIIDRRFFRKILKDYERSGILLSSSVRHNLATIDKTIADLESQFSKNLTDDDTTITLTKKELDGLPENIMKTLKLKNPDNKEETEYIIDFSYPIYHAGMKYIHNPSIREKLDKTFNSICMDKNSKILVELILLRQRRANLLGYDNHAEFSTELLVSRNPEVVQKFLTDIHIQIDNIFYEEIRALMKFVSKTNINSWDISYYFNKLEEEIIGANLSKKMTGLFTISQVQDISFSLCEKLFDIKFVKSNDFPVWNVDVSAFKVFSKNVNIGTLYLDLFPRKNKFGHNATFTIMPYSEYFDEKMNTKEKQFPIVAIVTNLSRLNFTHSEFTTFLHELGHVIHIFSGTIKYVTLSEKNVELDFAEVPSKLFEHWSWAPPDILKQFIHPDTKQSLTDAEINLLNKKKNLRNGFQYKRQILLSQFDLSIHSNTEFLKRLRRVYRQDPQKAVEIIKLVYETIFVDVMRSLKIKSPKFSIPYHRGTFFPARWEHLIDYDSKYYSYLWSEVISEDIYNTKFKKNPYDAIEGKDYKTKVLEKGASAKAIYMIYDLLKRFPSMESFFENKVYQVRGRLENVDYVTENSDLLRKCKILVSTKSS
jgi:Zn-dependent oligopeptidase